MARLARAMHCVAWPAGAPVAMCSPHHYILMCAYHTPPPFLVSAAARALVDNTCKARETKLKEFEEDFVFVETRVAGSITSSPLIQEIEKELIAVEREIEKDIKLVETEVVKDVVGIEREIEKDVVAVEQEIEKDVKSLFGFGKK